MSDVFSTIRFAYVNDLLLVDASLSNSHAPVWYALSYETLCKLMFLLGNTVDQT